VVIEEGVEKLASFKSSPLAFDRAIEIPDNYNSMAPSLACGAVMFITAAATRLVPISNSDRWKFFDDCRAMTVAFCDE
jgi:hypothetical protein